MSPAARHPVRALAALAACVVLAGCAKDTSEAARKGAQDAGFLMQVALNDFRAGRYESALKNLEQARLKAPQDRQVHYLLAVVLIERGQYQRAVESADAGLAVAPDDPELLNARGIARLRDRRYDEAIRDFQSALAPEKQYATPETVLANLAAAYAGQGKTEDAVATYWKALELKPTDGMLRTALCQTLAAAGRSDVALRECIRASTDSPSYAPAFEQKGDVLRTLGKKDDAIAAYRKAFELAPKGDAKEGVRRKLLDLGSDDPAVTGKRKDRWELPATLPDEVNPTLP